VCPTPDHQEAELVTIATQTFQHSYACLRRPDLTECRAEHDRDNISRSQNRSRLLLAGIQPPAVSDDICLLTCQALQHGRPGRGHAGRLPWIAESRQHLLGLADIKRD
jgi:hypothetical protein